MKQGTVVKNSTRTTTRFANTSFINLIVLIFSINCCFTLQFTQPVNGINSNNIDGGSGVAAVATANTKSDLTCIPELLTRGATFPKGDIKLNIGDTLEVNCTLDTSNPDVQNLTSADIEFSFNKHEIAERDMKVTLIDQTTAMLRVENLNVSTPYLICSVRGPKEVIHICQNQVDVGYPPLPVENFECVARDWNRLNCTWNKPYNPVGTKYYLNYRIKHFLMHCGRTSTYNKTESCEWDSKTDPHYPMNAEYLFLVMNGSNPLKPQGELWHYKIHHWSIMVPAAPDRLTVKAESPHQIEVTWEFTNYELFKPGLEHRITACTIEHVEVCVSEEFISEYREGRLTKKMQVPFAYMNYRVDVQMKSPASNNTDEFWSKPLSVEILTLQKSPEFPPLTTPGSYEVFNKYQIRDIFVYWQNIPIHHHNGSDFHVEYNVYENGQLRDDITPAVETDSYALFKNMSMQSYKFEMYTKNSQGRSPNFSTLVVPSSAQDLVPVSVTKLYYENGTYEISWRAPRTEEEINSYTIFRCNASRRLPNNCHMLLDWDEVGPEQNLFIYKDLPEHHQFQFGVSAHTKEMSTRMILATCELFYDKVPGRITDVSILDTTSSTIHLRWNLECTYKPGAVTGFRITYCLVKPSQNTCTDLETNKKEIRVNETAIDYRVEDLEPYSRYMIAISIITLAGESQTSDPLFANTTEAAPSEPPFVRAIDSTNTSGLIVIEAPANPNGILKTYKIIYSAVDFGKPNQIEITLRDLITSNNSYTFNLTNLENNLNYSVSVMACTVGCSGVSEPAFLMTKYGSTRLTNSPNINYEHETFIISWDKPVHIGGPVDHFEVGVKRNGYDLYPDQPQIVKFIPSQSKYEHQVHLQCESNTNVSVQVRAVSIVQGEVLYGDWSPEGSLGCSGVAIWILWLIGFGVVTIMVIIIAVLSKTLWKKVKVMKQFDVTFPSGMELGGVNPPMKRRQNSGGDTHSFGKENMTYQIHLASNQSDEAKDFLSSDSTKENIPRGDPFFMSSSSLDNNGERQLPLQESIDEVLSMGVGKICDWSWQPNILTIAAPRNTDPDTACSEFTTNSLTVEIPTTSSPNLSSGHSTIDGYSEKMTSPSPTKPLLSDSVHYYAGEETDDYGRVGDYDIDDLEHYKKLGYEDRSDDDYQLRYSSRPSNNDSGIGIADPQSITVSLPSTSRSTSSSSEDESQSNQSLPLPPTTNPSGNEGRGIVVPEVPSSNSSAYIKWAYLKDDPIPAETNSVNKDPYYQVGILLEST